MATIAYYPLTQTSGRSRATRLARPACSAASFHRKAAAHLPATLQLTLNL